MKLRYLVPALGVLASLNTISAETVGGLTIGGFVDVIAAIENTSDDGEPSAWGFSSEVELRVGYKIGDAVTVQVDLEFVDSESNLEQAYINWALTDTFSLTAGKFTTYRGWVASDADGLYRINSGPITALYGDDLTGAAANFTFSETVSASFFLVNDLEDDFNGTDERHLGLGADVIFTVADVGAFNAEAGYNHIEGGEDDTAMIIFGANATLNLASYEPLTLGFELQYQSAADFDGDVYVEDTDYSALGLLAMANHTIPAGVPMSGTFMVQYVQADVENGTDASPSALEVALALLTNPTNDPNFGVNFELGFMTTDRDGTQTDGLDDELDSIWVAAEFLALIP